LNDLLRNLPRVDLILSLLNDTMVRPDIVKQLVSDEIESIRKAIIRGQVTSVEATEIANTINAKLDALTSPSLKRVINATGIVLHTNFGRAVLSEKTLNHLYETTGHYNTLEYDLEHGKRGSRYAHVESLICQLTGAESALVVNNNAAAVMLVLNTLAQEKEVILSRGELVEIGGSFRVPEVMRASGCQLVEVGTTNKTHLYDFENAITDKTGLILKVHTSNYEILGFTKTVPRSELSDLAVSAGIPFYEDLGSGALIDLSTYGIKREPLVQECLMEGVDLVSFSGDKLLGASQAGIIAGKKCYIDALKKNQLLRALRIDKLSLAALEHTLRMYLQPELLKNELPTLKMLAYSAEAVLGKINHFIRHYQATLDRLPFRVFISETASQVGGGALPLEMLPSYALCLSSVHQPNEVQRALRSLKIPVICTIVDDSLQFDFRTIFDDDFDALAEGLTSVFDGGFDE